MLFLLAGIGLDQNQSSDNHLILTIYLAGYALGFSISFGPLQWVLLTEIFPKNYTSTCYGFCYTANYLINFLYTDHLLELVNLLSLKSLLLFNSVNCFVAVWVFGYFVDERI